jgi:hypothetical protein
MMRRAFGTLWAAFSTALLGCIGTETENPEVGLRGRLVDSAGIPVAGALVHALPAGAEPGSAADSARTDGRGVFRLRDLAPNAYNITGDYNNGTLAALIADVRVTRRDSVKDLGTDTLRVPGSILGRVLYRGAARPDIPCFLSGTNYSAVADSSGYLLMTGIPRGTYVFVYYAQSFNLQNTRDTVKVESGQVAVLPPKELLDAF